MWQKRYSILVIPAFILFLPISILSESNYDYVTSPKSDIYFGHISYTEVKYDGKDPVVIREGKESPEIAVLNLPLTAGDTIRTTGSRRCEIQFDSGTIIRLDLNTELKIETIMAQSLSSKKKITNIVLSKGQIYIMYKRFNRPEIFQVVTPNAAAKLNHRTVATINAKEDATTDIQVKLGKACVLYGPDEKSIEEKKIKKLQKLTVSQEHQIHLDEYKPDIDFELWNESMNESFEEIHRGKSFIPQPIQKLPEAVFYFAQKYSNLYGEWVWNSLYGFVWRPNYNDYYPWGSWQPYLYGKWRELNGQLFWVPEESWGWIPYHLGLWMWDKKYGWVWIPGSAFAPAWVVWDFFRGYYTWRPWALWDWYYPYGYNPSIYYYYLTSYYSRYYYWDPYAGPDDKKGTPVSPIRKIRKDQLKKSANPPYSLPKKLKSAYNNVVSALERRDERVIVSLQKAREEMIIVKSKDLNVPRIQEKSQRFEQISKQIESSLPQGDNITQNFSQEPYQDAVQTFKRNALVSQLKDFVVSSFARENEKASIAKKDTFFSGKKTALYPKSGFDSKRMFFSEKTALGKKGSYVSLALPRISRSHTPMRFRDWNPDVKAARRIGVEITYSSRTNEIRCPALGLSSKNVVASRSGFSSRGGFHSSGSSHSSGSGSSSGSSTGGSRGGSSGGSKSGGVKK